MQPSKKMFQHEGKWIEKPTRTIILVCACGVKYIQTREHQDRCIKCLVKHNAAA